MWPPNMPKTGILGQRMKVQYMQGTWGAHRSAQHGAQL